MVKDKIIVISGPSGSGKTTVVKTILEKFKELSFSVSATTRKKRASEIDAKDYYFLTPKEFTTKIENDELLEYQEVYPDIFYGTLKSDVSLLLEKGKIPVLDIDVKGALNVKKIYGTIVMTIFLYPGNIEILEKRLKHRKSENAHSLKERLDKAKSEIGYAHHFDHIVCNDGPLENTLKETCKLITEFIAIK